MSYPMNSKERPIIFSAEMVNAILDGRKTQTRRVMKPQPEMITPGADTQHYPGYPWVKCPYGAPGDRLWVRESYVANYSDDIWVAYRADWDEAASEYVKPPKWKSPIHMPRWASRITLEITSVRVERLQEISEKDAKSEGIIGFEFIDPPKGGIGYPDKLKAARLPQAQYKYLWDSLNAKRGYPWSSNPFVWVIEFKRLKIS